MSPYACQGCADIGLSDGSRQRRVRPAGDCALRHARLCRAGRRRRGWGPDRLLVRGFVAFSLHPWHGYTRSRPVAQASEARQRDRRPAQVPKGGAREDGPRAPIEYLSFLLSLPECRRNGPPYFSSRAFGLWPRPPTVPPAPRARRLSRATALSRVTVCVPRVCRYWAERWVAVRLLVREDGQRSPPAASGACRSACRPS